ncbi:transcription termination/antitermination protein NusG [Kingella negevensis]|uniref:Transcription termination/antitermination protein NusG n=1 Tax=Kingella negevensis TaxID=1522312 RepID=A0A238HJT7_9NEIS|nr:transcription termination/antitermination protein NusG [Kingella negevensis]MDK4684970.1 transcription termination/antitermination protein NusG [Kingella negevensis]MDK4698236.1 transcription termination/antitermination protein NusG [Kingella negevensis]MDK4707789.1 transcription termination/antitermination protein NusG [Kingella negevensis]MDK4709313.1 transcription termination/antitermination protein NusG [Kingella negevensis]SNB83754.1 Uncharacterised protein [Kingella negevensis]
MSKRWYVVQAYSGFEKNVQKTLKERIARDGMEEYFGQILVPVEEVVDIKNGKRTVTERKFFPGYVLVEMEMTDSSWHLVKSTPRVNGFIGGTLHRPLPITQREVNAMMEQVKGNITENGMRKPRPKTEFDVGQNIRVTDGPFADTMGVVEQVDYEHNKLRVTVQIFGRETPVELKFGQVEKVI